MGLLDFLKGKTPTDVVLDDPNASVRQRVREALALGKYPSLSLDGALPFRLNRNETLLWANTGYNYYEQVTRRKTLGRSRGASFRVMKGVSIRTGGSTGTPVEYDEIAYRGTGLAAVTTKHVYFNGDRVVRLPIAKIIAVEPIALDSFYAVQITRDRASGHPEFLAHRLRAERDFLLDLLDIASVGVEEYAGEMQDDAVAEGDYVTPESDYGHED